MTIKQLAQNGAVLKKVIYYRYDDAKLDSVSALTFQFEGGQSLTFSADHNTDEIVWGMPEGAALKPIDLADTYPALNSVCGLSLTWCWEMINHQGYFDAVQLELTNGALTQTMILQFKVAASNIEIYELNRLSSPENR